ncbi:SGNH/GDSL hydrolase family protein [Staphylococcus coagulans]|uniref:SGNH/GDSL hydrolase family protein n=1 Tax=Staphylococcus coagulans TaxID=74706 RepID=UPI001F4C368A|nr:SGNH/GDSL hydrolase family protein [Staphylococcus coagulans]UNB47391.1 phage tail protein [Staphylococcus coagulans]
MPVLLKSLQGVGYPLNVKTKVTHKLNEESSLEIDIIENRATFDAIGAITKMWTITKVDGPQDLKEYRITLIDKTSVGSKEKVSIRAIPVELDDLNNKRVYQSYTESMTGKEFFDLTFKNTGYKYQLHAKVSASRFENLGAGETNLELLKKGLERYKLEYEYDPKTKTFHLFDSVQRLADYYIKAGVNANNVKIQEDATKCYTVIKGFGGFEDDQNYTEASLQFTFKHPLANVIGERHAPPIINSKITHEDTLKKAMELAIDESIKVSVTLDFVSLKTKFPEAEPKVGDVVKTVDDLIGFNDFVRIVEVTTERDAYHNIIKQDVVLGAFTIQQRHAKAVGEAANYVKALKLNKTDPARLVRDLQAQSNANTKIAQDLLGRTDKIKKEDKNVTTVNGTLIYDFTSKSDIKNIKTIATIGDSVAYGTLAKTNFTTMLGKKINATTTNLASPSATMSTTKDNNIYKQAEKAKAELIIVQGTDDDWVANIDIGTDKADTKTFYGAFYSLIELIKQNNPNSKILVMTATQQCYVKDSKITRKDTDRNKLGLTLEDYVNAQVVACNELNVPVFDAYHTDYFKPYSPAYRASSMPDGLHLNEKGHEVIMYELIKDYYLFYDNKGGN